MRVDELERGLPGRLDALGPAARAELLHVLMMPGFRCQDLLADKPRKERGETRGDSAQAPEEYGQEAMRAILLIPAAVAVILVIVYLVTRRADDEDDDGGILARLIDLLGWWP